MEQSSAVPGRDIQQPSGRLLILSIDQRCSGRGRRRIKQASAESSGVAVASRRRPTCVNKLIDDLGSVLQDQLPCTSKSVEHSTSAATEIGTELVSGEHEGSRIDSALPKLRVEKSAALLCLPTTCNDLEDI
ncbi:hypothetical protein PHSY_006852 [Pseudozyma hubeiensis SY62]|uniref:Uncharacterized protein n=1 Tax=Pseudozyma hubeiensis (strain SY62) TaxID=1305764 RepID=R9PDC7_PSEHS|nr:hypothetical protein PHSY_006852 [Pseudozyma hubeiensis SY62]GAC99252.1 hypothetical protein PHSY_006852 [Pseudozyma hubeiensis SY62]